MPKLTQASLAALVLCAPLVTAGCGSGSQAATPAGPSTGAAGGTVHVVMQSLAFNPATIAARVGQYVTWTQEDSSPHNVTYVSGPRFESSQNLIRQGSTFSLRLTEPGTIRYYCTIHPWMKATIVVSP